MTAENAENQGLPVPGELQAAGRRLWGEITGALEPDELEVDTLRRACVLADRAAALDRLVKREGLMIDSSQGRKLHPAVAEARSTHSAVRQLLRTIKIVDDGQRDRVSTPASMTTLRARKAAQARWRREAERGVS